MTDFNVQERYYSSNVDYRRGSPHLAHPRLRDWLVSLLLRTLNEAASSGRPRTVLEAGAGHGGYTEPVLASGAHCVAVEMSRSSVAELQRKFEHNTSFRAVYSPDGSLDQISDVYTLAMAVSVLHHVPDYLKFVTELGVRVAPGGSLITMQDPMWYPRHEIAHRLETASYLLWRFGQGQFRRGLATRFRRVRGVYDDENPSDTVEYHVVRQGCDEVAISAELRQLFAKVRVIPYWSSQPSLGQRIGERLGLENTFAVIASGRY